MIFAKYPPVMKGKLKVGRIKCFPQIHPYVTGHVGFTRCIYRAYKKMYTHFKKAKSCIKIVIIYTDNKR